MILKPYIHYFYVKDAFRESGNVVPADRGDGDVQKPLKEALAENSNCFLSLEPHLSKEYGDTGAERFKVAGEGLRTVLREI